MSRLVRPLHFIAWSVPLFAVWRFALEGAWLTMVARLFAATALTVGLQLDVIEVVDGRIHFGYGDVEWSNAFGATGISIVAFVALVLATGGIPRTARARMLFSGTLVILATQILGLWSDVVHVHFADHRTGRAFANGLRAFLTGLGTFLFPFLVWLYCIRHRLPLPLSRPKHRGTENPTERRPK